MELNMQIGVPENFIPAKNASPSSPRQSIGW